jgi:hypothetical protein
MGNIYPHTAHEKRYKYIEIEPSELEKLLDADVIKCDKCYKVNNARCPLE